jgi:hypothetical protein
MSQPSNEDAVRVEELLQAMPWWQRGLLKGVVMPLLKGWRFLVGLVRTRWEIVPLAELPAIRERGGSHAMDAEQVRGMIARRYPFLCPECRGEVEVERQDAEELVPGVWELRKYGRCAACAADREHWSRLHHGYLLFREDGRWMAVVPHVPLLRGVWLWLRGGNGN